MKALIFLLLLWVKNDLVVSDECVLNYNDTGIIANSEKKSCTFYVSNNINSVIVLKLTKMELKDSDTLVIMDGTTLDKSVVSYNSSSKVKLQVIAGLSNKMTIVFKTNNNISDWSFYYDARRCDVSVDSTWNSRVDSPLYLPTPSKFINCTYNLTSTAPFSDYTTVASLSQFSLKGNSTLELISGSKQVKYIENSALIDSFADSTTNNFVVALTISDAGILQGFTMIVSTVSKECSGVVQLNKPFEFSQLPVQSVGYECRWLLDATVSGKSIIANISSLDIAVNSDSLTFIDGGSSNGSVVTAFKDDVKEYIVTGSNSLMIVSFVADNTEKQRAIVMNASVSDLWNRTNGQGYVGFQNKTHNDTIYYQLIANSGSLVNVAVLTDLPEKANVTFHRGLQLNNEIITVLDKTSILKNVIGDGSMLLELSGFTNGTKFNASFTSIKPDCNNLATSISGQITYTKQSDPICNLTIAPASAKDSTIILNIDFLQYGKDSSLEVYQGINNAVLVAQIVGGPLVSRTYPLQIYIPTLETASVVRKAAAGTSSTVAISYQTSKEVCGGSLLTVSGTISTPNYPHQYPLNAYCVWTPNNVPNKVLYLKFKDLQLVQNHSISVINKTNSTAGVTYVGVEGSTYLPADMVFNWTTDMQIEFQSSKNQSGDINQVARGANIEYTVMDCGRTLYGNGSFSYHEPAQIPSYCVWVIDVKDHKNKSIVNIVNFTINSDPKFLEFITIHDGNSTRVESLVNISIAKPKGFLSRYDSIVVVLNYTTKKEGVKTEFSLNYTTQLCREFCHNGICLHEDWKCNGDDNCGDNTDEKNCTYVPTTPIPPPTTPSSSDSHSGFVKSGWVPACLFIGVLLGAILVFAVPKIIRRVRGRGGNYSRMGDNTVNA